MENESCALYKGKMWSILNQDGGPGTHFITAPNSICVDCYKKINVLLQRAKSFQFHVQLHIHSCEKLIK